jgi:hypothetical protein
MRSRSFGEVIALTEAVVSLVEPVWSGTNRKVVEKDIGDSLVFRRERNNP